jgi:cell division protein FtsW
VGKGPGQSVQRDFLPHAVSDFIYAIIIEEGGIEGGILVMFMYLLLLYRAMRIAERCKNRFPAYLVMGLSLMLVVQAMVNMAVSVGAMPVTGQPLPLVSKGGTSTFITCAYIGMILSVSHTAKQLEQYTTAAPAQRQDAESEDEVPMEIVTQEESAEA